MILPLDTPDSPSKTVRAGPPSESISSLVTDEDLSPPPAYAGPVDSDGTHGRPAPIQYLHPQHGDVEAQTYHVYTSIEVAASSTVVPFAKRTSTSMRVLKTFGILVLVLVVLGTFARTVVTVARLHNHHDHELENMESQNTEVSLIPFPKASDGVVEECISLSSFAADTVDTRPMVTFNLSSTTNVLYVFGRGALARGAFTLTSSNDPSIPKDSIRVDITPHYASSLALEKANFCVLSKAPGEKSIGILASENWGLNRGLTFSIHIRLQGHRALHVKTFQEDLLLFSHAPLHTGIAPSWNSGHYQILHLPSGYYHIPVPTSVSSMMGTWLPHAHSSSMYNTWGHSGSTAAAPVPTYIPRDVSFSS